MELNLRANTGIKWETVGRIRPSQFGGTQASFRVKDLEALISIAKANNKEWVNMSVFTNTPQPAEKPVEAPAKKPEKNILDDEIPWG